MTRRAWTITTELTGQPRKIEVYLYDTLGHMRAAMTQFDKLKPPPFNAPGLNKNALASTEGLAPVTTEDDGYVEHHELIGIMRFTRGHLSAEVVTHEIVHIAMHLYGIDMVAPEATAADLFTAHNEDFAYLYGGLFATFMDMFGEELY